MGTLTLSKSIILAATLAAGGLIGAGSVASLAGSAAAAPVKNCAPAQLVVRLGRSQGTAGTTYYPIVFTNRAANSCAVFGVPSVQAVYGAAHHALGPAAKSQSMGQMPARHVLAKGHSVSGAFGVVDTGVFSPRSCAAKISTGIVVSLGSFVPSRYLRLAISVCTKRTSLTTRLIVSGVNGY
jgi:hypothetical protein